MKVIRWVGLFFFILAVSSGLAAAQPTIALFVDATDAARKIFHAQLKIPASPGELTLYYPKWIPGEHAASGPVADLAGLKFLGNGRPLEWRRDLGDAWTFHVQVPRDVHEVDVVLDFISPAVFKGGFSSGSSATEHLAVINWNQVVLYPKGWPADQIIYKASLYLPKHWQFGTALQVVTQNNDEIEFAPVSLYTLVDSPVIAGEYFQIVHITDDARIPIEIDVAADSQSALDVPGAAWAPYKGLLVQADALFGAKHFDRYNFLLTLSDHVAHYGLEHHQSNDSRLDERGLLDPDKRLLKADRLPHEYVHSWNGKYRRPIGLATSDYQQPVQTDLLWIYEGLTAYLGDVLTTRSGLWTEQDFHDQIAKIVADMDHRPGRVWRNLQDTADSASQIFFMPDQWSSWRRGTDFYNEDVLNWLWADSIIREQTHGKKSLDDFCRLFLGPPGNGPAINPYTFEDIISGLQQVAAYDWRAFWDTRLNAHFAKAPSGGVERSGWKVIYDSTPSRMHRAWENDNKEINAAYSIGLYINNEAGPDYGRIVDTIEGMPAANAKIGPGMKLVAINNKRYSEDVFRDALRASVANPRPIEFLIENLDDFRIFTVAYHGGERYPHLVRDQSRPDNLSEVIRTR